MTKFALTLSAVAILTAAVVTQAQANPRTVGYTTTSARASPQRSYTASNYRGVSATAYRTNSTTVRATNYTANTYARSYVNTVARTNYATAPRANYSVNRSYVNYHLTYGTRFAYGYCYRGRTHYHWTYQRYEPRYGCTLYYDPCCTCWYYWCEPQACYYPVSYCPYQTYVWSAPVVQPVVAVQSRPVQAPVTYQQPVQTAVNYQAPVQTPVTYQAPVQTPVTYQAPVQATLPPPRGGDAPPREYTTGTSTLPPVQEPVTPTTDE